MAIYKLKLHCHTFLACWLLTSNRSLYNVFYIRLALDSSNWIKICLDSSSRILESCPFGSPWLFIGDFEQVYVHVSSLPYDYILQFWYAWAFPEVNIIVLALNIVDSPNLLFIPIVSGQFEQVLPNVSSFDQSTVSSSLRKFVKPKKSEKHSQSSVSKIISKPGCGLVVIICANKNKQYIYTNKDVIIYPGKGLHLRVFRNWLNEFFCKTLVKQLFSMS